MENFKKYYALAILFPLFSIGLSSTAFSARRDSTSNNPFLDSFPRISLTKAAREKRDTSPLLRAINERLIVVEDHTMESNSALENLTGFLTAIGFFPESDRLYENPCKGMKSARRDQSNQNELVNGNDYNLDEESFASSNEDDNEWTYMGSSSCVKVITGLFTYNEAVDTCRNTLQIGRDIAYPEISRMDSTEKQNALLGLLRAHQPSVTGVWVQRATRPTGVEQQCTQLRNERSITRQGPGYVPWNNVECVRTNSIVCERTLPISYAEIVRNQAESVNSNKKLKAQMERTVLENQRTISQLNSNQEQFEVGLTQLNLTFNTQHIISRREIDNLMSWGQLKEEQGRADFLKTEQFSIQIQNISQISTVSQMKLDSLQKQVQALSTKEIGELQRWKQHKDAGEAADSLKIQQLSTQIENMSRNNRGTEQKLVLLQRQVQSMSNEEVASLIRWKQLKDEQRSADTLRIQQLSNQIANLNRKQLESDQKLTLLVETIEELLSWKSNQLTQQTQPTTTTTTRPTQNRRRYIGTSRAIFKNGEISSTTESDAYADWME